MSDTKSNTKIQIPGTNEVLEGTIEPVTLFNVVTALRDRYGASPQVCFYDDELQDWTCWQPTEKVEPKPKKRRKAA